MVFALRRQSRDQGVVLADLPRLGRAAGRKAEATKVLDELLKLNKERYVTPAAVANVYIGLGDKDQTFVWLEKAFQERSNYLAYLKVFPIMDPLRSDPRFPDLVHRVGLS